MLKKKEVQEVPSEIKSILSEGLRIEGNIYAEGKIRIDGEVKGDVQGSYIILGESSKVGGNIKAEHVVAMGEITGNVEAKEVEVKSTARIKGDISSEKLSIEKGASISGNVKSGSYLGEEKFSSISLTASSGEITE